MSSTGSNVALAQFRIGHGYDVHAFSKGRKFMLGGVEISHHSGPLGHSDADVLLHAIIDALLGALSWGDIGSWFPNTDPSYKNISSSVLFERVWKKVRQEGYTLVNCDTVVLLEKPKLRPYIDSICATLAELFSCSREQISVKATTTERLGFIGREEGISASAVVMLARGDDFKQ